MRYILLNKYSDSKNIHFIWKKKFSEFGKTVGNSPALPLHSCATVDDQ